MMNNFKFIALAISTFLVSTNCYSQSQKFRDWNFSMSPSDGIITVVTSDISISGVSFGKLCFVRQQKCGFILMSNLTCSEGKKYPILVNASISAHGDDLTCFTVGTKSFFIFSDTSKITYVTKESSKLSVAFPLQNGGVATYSFSLNGATEALDFIDAVMVEAQKRK